MHRASRKARGRERAGRATLQGAASGAGDVTARLSHARRTSGAGVCVMHTRKKRTESAQSNHGIRGISAIAESVRFLREDGEQLSARSIKLHHNMAGGKNHANTRQLRITEKTPKDACRNYYTTNIAINSGDATPAISPKSGRGSLSFHRRCCQCCCCCLQSACAVFCPTEVGYLSPNITLAEYH